MDLQYLALLPVGITLGVATFYLGENIYRPDNKRPSDVAGTATTASAAALGIHNFVFPATIAFAILYTSFLVKTTSLRHSATKPFLLLCLLGLDLTVLITCANTPIFQKCGILGCTFASPSLKGKTFGGHDDYADDYNMPQSYTNSNALIYFFTSLLALPFLLAQSYRVYSHEVASDAKPSAAVRLIDGSTSGSTTGQSSLKDTLLPPNINSSNNNSGSGSGTNAIAYAHLRRQQQQKHWLAVLLVLFLLLPIQIILTSRLGNNFQWIFPYEVAKWAAREIVSENNIGYVLQHRVSADLVLKLFPDVALFYGYIYLNCLAALLVQAWPRLRQWSRTSHPLLLWLPAGEVVFWLGFAGFLVATFLYWYLVHGWEGNPISAVTTADRFARTIAQVALSMMGLMILPVARNSVWTLVFGISWETMVRFHRLVSRAFLVAVLMHMLSFWYAFSEKRVFPQAIFGAQPNGWIKDNETISVMSVLVLFFVLPIMGLLTLNVVRRKYFELFYFSHFISMALFASTLWHAASAWYFMLPGLALWAIDHALRFTKSCERVHTVSLRPVAPGITEVKFVCSTTRAPLGFEAGQYIFLSVPDIALLEFHPFTLSSSPLDDAATCHIKAVDDPSQFSSKLHKLALEAEEGVGALPIIHVDGPYGLPLDFNAYTSILLIGGGIGVTPLHSILRTLVLLAESGGLESSRLCKVRLVWASKDVATFAIFRDTFERIAARARDSSAGKRPLEFEARFYSSTSASLEQEHEDIEGSKGGDSLSPSPITVTTGRISIEKEIDALRSSSLSDRPLVFVCGPEVMVREACVAAKERDVEVHSEVFLL